MDGEIPYLMPHDSFLFHVARNDQVSGHLTERDIGDGLKKWTFSQSDMGLAAGSEERHPVWVLFPPEPKPAWMPPAALGPKSQSRAGVSRWLDHPNEIGEAPSFIGIYDQRKLYWPPTVESLTVRLLKFSCRSEEKTKTGSGMVGVMVLSSFKEYAQLP